MNLVLVGITTIDICIMILVLIGGILLIKRQDHLRHDYFLFKKRTRILREFKEIYYSYYIYRAELKKNDINTMLKKEKIVQLVRNRFWGNNNEDFFENLDNDQNYLSFRERLVQLDHLSDDFDILFLEKEALPIKNFLFWYRILMLEIGNYKKDLIEGRGEYSSHLISIETKLKRTEQEFTKLNTSFIIEKLNREARLVNQ